MDASNKILYTEKSFATIGACMNVDRTLGAGLLEGVYEEALEKELCVQKIPYKRQVKLSLYYDN
jgi:GxxExxY protein